MTMMDSYLLFVPFSHVQKLIPLPCVVAGIMTLISSRILILATMAAFSSAWSPGPPPAPRPAPAPNPNFIPSDVAVQLTTDTLNALSSVNTANTGGILVNSASVFSSFAPDDAGTAPTFINAVATGAAGIFANP
jgi:hypothetical protein